jgi:hypothetical protein
MNLKKKLTTALACLALLIGCLLSTSCINSSISPAVAVYGMWIDTTAIQSTQTPIEVGDTLRLSLGLRGYGHQLNYFKVDFDREYFKDSLFSQEDLERLCVYGTNPEKGYYLFQEGTTDIINVTWHLIPLKAREKQDISFPVQMIIQNDTKVDNQFNPNVLGFVVLVSDSTLKK